MILPKVASQRNLFFHFVVEFFCRVSLGTRLFCMLLPIFRIVRQDLAYHFISF